MHLQILLFWKMRNGIWKMKNVNKNDIDTDAPAAAASDKTMVTFWRYTWHARVLARTSDRNHWLQSIIECQKMARSSPPLWAIQIKLEARDAWSGIRNFAIRHEQCLIVRPVRQRQCLIVRPVWQRQCLTVRPIKLAFSLRGSYTIFWFSFIMGCMPPS